MAIIIILLSLLGSAFGDLATHIYPADCAPPTSFGNDTGVSTPGYVTLRPIERCCPQMDQCHHLGGFCAVKWLVELYPQCCDFTQVEACRDYSCQCCIKCSDDKCSPCAETGGECRKECRSGELEDYTNTCNYYNKDDDTGCKCCKKCEAMTECYEAEGICVTDPDYCPQGTFASSGCCGGCYCCKPVLVPHPDGGCDAEGAYCSETSDCATGFYSCFGNCIQTLFTAGLQTTELGFCCLPKVASNKAGRSLDRIGAIPFNPNLQKVNRKHPKQIYH